MAENRGYSRLVVQNTEIKCCGKAINHKTIGEKKKRKNKHVINIQLLK